MVEPVSLNLHNAHAALRFYTAHLGPASPEIIALGSAGGFSGAEFWKVRAAGTTWLLRCWPREYRDPQRLVWIHRVLGTATANGCTCLPVPLEARDGNPFAVSDGALWQLEPWMPGSASYWSEPNDSKLVNAMRKLAMFHRSVDSLRQSDCPSPSLNQRIDLLDQLWANERPGALLARIEAACAAQPENPLFELSQRVCHRFRQLASGVAQDALPLRRLDCVSQPILADVWHDHVLFCGNQVSGIVDFGAMRMDTPAADVARLLGSLAGDHEQKWRVGMAGYFENSALPENDRILVRIFDQTTTLLSGMNWLRWIFVEKREFGELRPVMSRLDRIVARLDALAGTDPTAKDR